MKQGGSNGGFTLIELVITVAIVGILAMVAMPLAETATKRNKEGELRTALRELRGLALRVEEVRRALVERPVVGAVEAHHVVDAHRVEETRDVRAATIRSSVANASSVADRSCGPEPTMPRR